MRFLFFRFQQYSSIILIKTAFSNNTHVIPIDIFSNHDRKFEFVLNYITCRSTAHVTIEVDVMFLFLIYKFVGN